MAIAALCTPAARAKGKAPVGPDSISAREAFVKLPLGTLDLLRRSTRLDMLDYFDADSIWQAPNAMEGSSHLIDVTPDYLKASITDVSTLTVRTLPSPAGTIVMTLYTVGTPEEGPDTEIRFFDAAMNPLETRKFISTPEVKDFLDIPKGVNRKEIESLIPFPTVEWSVAKESPTLTGRMTLGNHLPLESSETVSKYLRPALTWTWNGKKFSHKIPNLP